MPEPIVLSIVIPAYNEGKNLRQTLDSVRATMQAVDLSSYEIIVADDHSTDDTAQIARDAGARVVVSGKRNIGATRNVGAQAAQGQFLLFLDADTLVNPRTVSAMLLAFASGAVGGGAYFRWSAPAPLYSRLVLRLLNWISRSLRSPAGAFFFARKEAFDQVGGFDEKYFLSEELYLANNLKRLGQLVILREAIATSPRKFAQFSFFEMLRFLWRTFCHPGRVVRDRKELEIWYTRRG